MILTRGAARSRRPVLEPTADSSRGVGARDGGADAGGSCNHPPRRRPPTQQRKAPSRDPNPSSAMGIPLHRRPLQARDADGVHLEQKAPVFRPAADVPLPQHKEAQVCCSSRVPATGSGGQGRAPSVVVAGGGYGGGTTVHSPTSVTAARRETRRNCCRSPARSNLTRISSPSCCR